MQETEEGKIIIKIPQVKIVSKEMDVFYNPIMSFNRDIAIILLKALNKKHLRIADPLAGSGIRGARFLKELPKTMVEHVAFNDNNKNFKKTMRSLIKLNNLPKNKISVHNKDASLFLLESEGFDYIDIDPFGSPNPYLDASIKRLSRKGILAVTATDTSALAGSHEGAGKRKYWAKPLHNELMHEVGLRILVRKIQLIAAQYDKALVPIFSHASEHYLRVYLSCTKGKKAVNEIFKNQAFLLFCSACRDRKISYINNGTCTKCKKEYLVSGPLWIGSLWDQKIVQHMLKINKETKWLQIIIEEARIPVVGFYALPELCRLLKCSVPKKERIITILKNKGYFAAQTHFVGDGIRTTAPASVLWRLLSRSSIK